MKNKIFIASDHAGYELKVEILQYYKDTIIDLGTNSLESVDYPEYALKLVEKVKSNKLSFGILICGTGIGMSIAANKMKDIRCALCTTVEMAKMARKHNNANVLALGGRILEESEALEILFTFCKTKFEGGRHQR
ncbi:uncharacterized protein METZ01_LOCUS499422, partial [marine metagenome]